MPRVPLDILGVAKVGRYIILHRVFCFAKLV